MPTMEATGGSWPCIQTPGLEPTGHWKWFIQSNHLRSGDDNREWGANFCTAVGILTFWMVWGSRKAEAFPVEARLQRVGHSPDWLIAFGIPLKIWPLHLVARLVRSHLNQLVRRSTLNLLRHWPKWLIPAGWNRFRMALAGNTNVCHCLPRQTWMGRWDLFSSCGPASNINTFVTIHCKNNFASEEGEAKCGENGVTQALSLSLLWKIT